MTGTVAYGDFAAQQAGVSGAVGAGLELPWNIEAEQGLLGTMMVEPEVIDDIADLVDAAHFYSPAHGRIFQAIMALHGGGRAPGPVLVRQFFTDDADLAKVGGADYIAALAAGVVTAGNARHYAQTIHDLSQRRGLIAACGDAMAQARHISPDVPAARVVDDLESVLFSLSETGLAQGGPVDLSAGLDETLELIDLYQKGQVRGVKTGLSDFDERTNGLHAGHLIILAGRPSMGKSALAISIAHNVARQGKSCLFFSMEMPRTELIQRLYARYTGLSTGFQMREGGLKLEHWNQLHESRQDMRGMKLAIDDTPALAVAQIRSRARRYKRRQGLDLIVIDQLTKIPLPPHYQNKVDQVGFITNALKDLGRELGVPVLLLHQLSRKVEERDDKRPQLSDLRDSGNIEQDADAVVFVYRDEYYLERSEPKRHERETEEKFADRMINHRAMLDAAQNKAEAIIAKYRQGKVGTVYMSFDPVRQIFSNLHQN